MPLRDKESSVMPYVTIAAQKGALPNTAAGNDLHHKEVTSLLLIAISSTIVIAGIIWICVRIKTKLNANKSAHDQRQNALD